MNSRIFFCLPCPRGLLLLLFVVVVFAAVVVYSRWQLKHSRLVVTANETGVKDLSLLAVVTAMVRDRVIVVGVLIVVVIVQRGFDFVVSFCFGSVQFGLRAMEPSSE